MSSEREVREKTWTVSLAALLHDVGKLAQRAEADPDRFRSLENLHEFAVQTKTGGWSRHHAAYTWQFIADNIPWLTKLGSGSENVAGWAARHHNPSSVWDHIVTQADKLSAGMDRGHDDELAGGGWEAVQTRRLTPVLGRVAQENGEPFKQAEDYELPLIPLTPSEHCFPAPCRHRSHSEARDEYEKLFSSFTARVRTIPGGDLPRFFHSFLAVYEKYAWSVPAATNIRVSDISLFDHSRAAAALAAVITYDMMTLGKSTTAEIGRAEDLRFLLAVVDLSGLQRFIYTISHQRAAKMLRGRSLFLHLLMDAITNQILEQLGFPPTNLLYSGGGKAWMLLPVSAKSQLLEFAANADLKLGEAWDTRLSFSIGTASFTGRTLFDKQLGKVWAEATTDLLAQRRRRYHSIAKEHYEKVFAPRPAGSFTPEQPCQICGQVAGSVEYVDEEGRRMCHPCRKLEELGKHLPSARAILRVSGEQLAEELKGVKAGTGEKAWLEVADFDAAYWMTAHVGRAAKAAGPADVVFGINDLPEDSGSGASGIWFLGHNRPVSEDYTTATFDDLAKSSHGAPYLGVLRMDVDSLGLIFQEGFNFRSSTAREGSEAQATEHSEASISRLANLSKGLTYFFGAVISAMVDGDEAGNCPWAGKTQIIYSGGDDLFIVGAWSALPALALKIRETFGLYTCGNPRWGISGGLTIIPSGFPVAAAAAGAAKLESTAKAFSRNGGKSKDALAFLPIEPAYVPEDRRALCWSELKASAALAAELIALIASQGSPLGGVPGFPETELPPRSVARGVIHRCKQIAAAYLEGRQRQGEAKSGRDLMRQATRGRWAWLAAYGLPRAATEETTRERLSRIVEQMHGEVFECTSGQYKTTRLLIELLLPAATWAELLTRERRT